ncbi:MAG TPA: hypothetical protein VGI19_19085 [Candidatus Cybelea sp.]
MTRVLRSPVAPEDSISRQFDKLSEVQRVDFIFAIATLEDPSTTALLEHALDDPCEAVALAAARALTNAGCAPRLERFFAAHRNQRSARLAQALELLG